MKKIYRILIVDDDEISNFLTKATIRYVYEDTEIKTVSNGMQAMEYFLKNPRNIPEIIFLDINMPIMNGFAFLDWYESSGFSGNTKICMLSSSLDIQEKRRALGYRDVVGFINKPLQYESIHAFIESL
jgi:CheY-like chemotaxis protein